MDRRDNEMFTLTADRGINSLPDFKIYKNGKGGVTVQVDDAKLNSEDIENIEEVVANNGEATTSTLSTLQIGDTNYAINGGGGGGTTVIANPELDDSDEVLVGLQVGETKYKIPEGGGGGTVEPAHVTIDWWSDSSGIGYEISYEQSTISPEELIDLMEDGQKKVSITVQFYSENPDTGDYIEKRFEIENPVLTPDPQVQNALNITGLGYDYDSGPLDRTNPDGTASIDKVTVYIRKNEGIMTLVGVGFLQIQPSEYNFTITKQTEEENVYYTINDGEITPRQFISYLDQYGYYSTITTYYNGNAYKGYIPRTVLLNFEDRWSLHFDVTFVGGRIEGNDAFPVNTITLTFGQNAETGDVVIQNVTIDPLYSPEQHFYTIEEEGADRHIYDDTTGDEISVTDLISGIYKYGYNSILGYVNYTTNELCIAYLPQTVSLDFPVAESFDIPFVGGYADPQSSFPTALPTHSITLHFEYDGSSDPAYSLDNIEIAPLFEDSSSGGSGTTVIANPTLDDSDEILTGLQVGTEKYKIKVPKIITTFTAAQLCGTIAEMKGEMNNPSFQVAAKESGNISEYHTTIWLDNTDDKLQELLDYIMKDENGATAHYLNRQKAYAISVFPRINRKNKTIDDGMFPVNIANFTCQFDGNLNKWVIDGDPDTYEYLWEDAGMIDDSSSQQPQDVWFSPIATFSNEIQIYEENETLQGEYYYTFAGTYTNIDFDYVCSFFDFDLRPPHEPE